LYFSKTSENPLHALPLSRKQNASSGPWDMMEDYDNFLPNRKFDNFQFVNYHSVTSKVKNPDANLALHAMMEIPHQYVLLSSFT
jgi:hypothetical protein